MFTKAVRTISFVLIAMMLAAGFAYVDAASPSNIITYQGRVLNANGVPVSDSSLNMKFFFYTASSGGTCVWSNSSADCDSNTPGSTTAKSVTLTSGLYTQNLGDTGDSFAAIGDSIFADNGDLYLEVIIGSETLSPRRRLTAAPYALNAQTLDGNTATDFLSATGDTGTGIYDFTGAVFSGASPIVVEGATADDFESTFAFTDPTADRTITFQDASGTVAFTSDITGGLFEDGTNGVYEDDEAVIIGTDTAFSYATGGVGDLRVADELEVIGNAMFDGNALPANAGTETLGSSSAEWGGLFLGDNDSIQFGADQDYQNLFNPTDSILTFTTGSGTSGDTDYGLFTFAVEADNGTATANQEVFEVGRQGVDDSDANFVELFAIDEDGDTSITGDLTITGGNITSALTLDSTLNVTGTADFAAESVFTLPASSSVVVDADTTNSTNTDGAIDINFESATNGAEAMNILARSSSAADNDIISALVIDLDDDSSVAASSLIALDIAASDTTGSATLTGIYLDSSIEQGLILEDGVALNFGTPTDIGLAGDVSMLWSSADSALNINGGLVSIGVDPGGATATGTGDLIVVDALEVDGVTDLDSTLTVAGDATFDGNILPNAGETIGSTSAEWNGVYIGNDSVGVTFGAAQDYTNVFDSSAQVLRWGTDTASSNSTEEALFTFAFDTGGDTGPTTDQEIFEIGSEATDDSEAGWTELFAIDNEGDVTAAGDITANDFACTDCLDFTELSDTLALDASTTITSDGSESFNIRSESSNAINVNLASTGGFVVQDNGSNYFTFTADKTLDYTTDQTTSDQFDFTADSLTTGSAIDMSLDALTTGKAFNVASTSSALSTGNIIDLDHTATYTATTNRSGNEIEITRDLTINGGGQTLTNSGALISATNTGTQTSGTLTDTANIFEGTQNYAASTGGVFVATNAGSGSSFFANQDGNGYAINVDSEATSAGIVNLDVVMTSGTIIGSNYTGSTTGSGTLTGLNLDFDTNFTADGNGTLNGAIIALDGLTNTTSGGTAAITGMNIQGNALDTAADTNAQTITWKGLEVTIPATIDTGEAGDTVTATGINIVKGTLTGGGGTEDMVGIALDSTKLDLDDDGDTSLQGLNDDEVHWEFNGVSSIITMKGNPGANSAGASGHAIMDINYTVPADNTGTNKHIASLIDIDGITNVTGGTNTVVGLSFANMAGDANVNSLHAIEVGSLTGTGSTNEAAVVIGGGWDASLSFGDSSNNNIWFPDGSAITFEDANGNDMFYIADHSTSDHHVITGDANTGLQFSGMTTDITTDTDEDLTITPNGTGDVVINKAVEITEGGDEPMLDLYATQEAMSGTTAILSIRTDDETAGDFYFIKAEADVNGSASTVFAVEEDGRIRANFTSSGTERICGPGASYGLLTDCTGSPGDYAEHYGTNDASIGAGDIVMIDPTRPAYEVVQDGYVGSKAFVVKSNQANQRVLGIVSTHPNETIGENFEDHENPRPIALNGRVPVKVTDENGPIEIGDYVVASSTAGYGMKAVDPGYAVGMAISNYDASSPQGFVLVNVQSGWNPGEIIDHDGTATVLTDKVVVAALSDATADTPSIDSFGLALRGSAWNGAEAQAVEMLLTNSVEDEDNYRLSIRNTTDAEVAYITNEGAMRIAGDMTIGGRFYPSDRGVEQTAKYIEYNSNLDLMQTNASGWAGGAKDFAENFPSEQSLEAGELVVFANGNEAVRRATGAEGEQLAGIVSTAPGFLAGAADEGFPIALAGRVPTRVSAQNGSIQVGDPLTASTTPGVAMKATDNGHIVGYALEPVSEGQRDIIVFVNVGYWAGGTQTTPGTNNIASGFNSSSPQNFTQLNMSGDIFLNTYAIRNIGTLEGMGGRWSIDSEGQIKTEGLLKTVIESHAGKKVETIAVTSPEATITLSGSSTLEGDEVEIRFEDIAPEYNDVISAIAPIRVLVTPSGPVSLYVNEKDQNHFTVKRFQGEGEVEFDWMVTAYRKGYEPEEREEEEEEEAEEVEVVDEVVEEEIIEEPEATEEETKPTQEEVVEESQEEVIEEEVAEEETIEEESTEPAATDEPASAQSAQSEPIDPPTEDEGGEQAEEPSTSGSNPIDEE